MGLHMQVIIALLLGIKRNGHIFIGLILGIIVGCCFPSETYPQVYSILDFIGQSFINIIQNGCITFDYECYYNRYCKHWRFKTAC